MTNEETKVLVMLYLRIHVSELKNLPDAVKPAWEIGQRLYQEQLAEAIKQ